jgi:hypothetical protein
MFIITPTQETEEGKSIEPRSSRLTSATYEEPVSKTKTKQTKTPKYQTTGFILRPYVTICSL